MPSIPIVPLVRIFPLIIPLMMILSPSGFLQLSFGLIMQIMHTPPPQHFQLHVAIASFTEKEY